MTGQEHQESSGQHLEDPPPKQTLINSLKVLIRKPLGNQ